MLSLGEGDSCPEWITLDPSVVFIRDSKTGLCDSLLTGGISSIHIMVKRDLSKRKLWIFLSVCFLFTSYISKDYVITEFEAFSI